MGGVASVSGTVKVGESGAPDISAALSIQTGTIAEQQKGKMKVAAGSHVLSFGTVTNGNLIWVKIRDNATGNARLATLIFSITGGATFQMEDVSQILLVAETTPTTVFTGCTCVIAGAGDADVEYIIAGDD
jgi:hypothetical protein